MASQRREQARRVYYGCVFKAKKEIPAKEEKHHRGYGTEIPD
jgi:hypothetical protein